MHFPGVVRFERWSENDQHVACVAGGEQRRQRLDRRQNALQAAEAGGKQDQLHRIAQSKRLAQRIARICSHIDAVAKHSRVGREVEWLQAGLLCGIQTQQKFGRLQRLGDAGGACRIIDVGVDVGATGEQAIRQQGLVRESCGQWCAGLVEVDAEREIEALARREFLQAQRFPRKTGRGGDVVRYRAKTYVCQGRPGCFIAACCFGITGGGCQLAVDQYAGPVVVAIGRSRQRAIRVELPAGNRRAPGRTLQYGHLVGPRR